MYKVHQQPLLIDILRFGRLLWAVLFLLNSFGTIAAGTTSLTGSESEQATSTRRDTTLQIYHLKQLHANVVYSNPLEAAGYIMEALQLATLIGDQREIATLHKSLGDNYRNLGLRTKALESYLKTLDLSTGLGIASMTAYALNDVGNIHYDNKQYGEALQYYRQALSTGRDSEDVLPVAVSFNNIGLVYKRLGLHDSAYHYHLLGLEERKKIKEPFYIAHSYNYLGEDLKNLGRYEEAKEILLQAEGIFNMLRHVRMWTSTRNQYADILNFEGKSDSAVLVYQAVYDTLSVNGNYPMLASQGIILAQEYQRRNRQSMASAILDSTIAIAERHGLLTELLTALQMQIEQQEQQNQWQKAFGTLQKYLKTLQQQNENEMTGKIGLIEAQLAANSKEEQLQSLQRESALREDALQAQRIKNNALFGVIGIIMILVIIIMFGFYQKARSNKELLQKNNIIAQQNNAIEQQNSELRLAKTSAERASAAKTEFVTNISHELRTPMNAIIGLTDLILERNILAADDLKSLESVRYSATYLVNILNEVLDMSRIEEGKINILKESFSMHGMADQLGQTFRHRIPSSVEFVVDIDKAIPENLLGDSTRIYQVITNLVGNAIKFTKNGSIRVNISPVSTQNDKYKIRFSVADTGIGMSAETVKRIFKRFEQASDYTERVYGGTGLGLAISHQLVQLMGGELKVDSTPDEGSNFYFDLVLSRAAKVKPLLKEAAAYSEPLHGIRILYAEDNEVNRFLAEQIFLNWKIDLAFAENGQQAVELAESERYDIILMDVQMPILDGIEATRIIRSLNTAISKVPIIGFTADVMEPTKKKAFDAGMDNIMVKPFNKEELFTMIRQYAGIDNKTV